MAPAQAIARARGAPVHKRKGATRRTTARSRPRPPRAPATAGGANTATGPPGCARGGRSPQPPRPLPPRWPGPRTRRTGRAARKNRRFELGPSRPTRPTRGRVGGRSRCGSAGRGHPRSRKTYRGQASPGGLQVSSVVGAWSVVRGKFTATTTHHGPRTLVGSTPALLTDFRIRTAYSEGAGIYRIVPAAVAIPRGVDELQRLVRWAADSGTPVVPRGAGSGMAGGSVGRDLVVDLSQGFRWTAPDWSRRTFWAGASVTWGDVTEAARPFGLQLPPDPSSGGFATSGGMVATNAAGPRSVRCGSVRRWVEAIEIIDADGEARRVIRGAGSPKGVPAGPGERFHLSADQRRLIATRFPKTRKNAAGYALDRFAESGDELDLLTGSEGTLAFITAVQWRLEPIPADVAGAALGFERLEQVAEAVPYLVALNPSAVGPLDRSLRDTVRAAAAPPGLPEGLEALLLIEFERETQAAARGVVGDAVRGLRASTAHVATAVDRAS